MTLPETVTTPLIEYGWAKVVEATSMALAPTITARHRESKYAETVAAIEEYATAHRPEPLALGMHDRAAVHAETDVNCVTHVVDLWVDGVIVQTVRMHPAAALALRCSLQITESPAMNSRGVAA